MDGGLQDRINLSRYRLVVFDLDGTLYRQWPVRRGMMRDLLLQGGALGRLARLRILRRFRQLRETFALTAAQGFERPLFARLSADIGCEETILRALVHEWMERRPLPRLRKARVPGSAALFAALRARATTVAVWSDYPVPDKLAALGMWADHQIWPGHGGLDALKPNPAGLSILMARTGYAAHQTLMIGDRQSHDGVAADAAGVDFLLRADRRPSTLGPHHFHVRDFHSLADAWGTDQ